VSSVPILSRGGWVVGASREERDTFGGEEEGMRGHVRKRGSSWAVVYDEGYDENGKRRQRWKSGFATRKEAQAFLTRVLSSLGDGSYVQPSKLTLREYLEDEWLPAIAGTVRPLTLTQYRSVMKGRILPRLGHHRLQALTGGHLNGLYRELEEEGLSAASRRLTHAVLSRALRDAVRWGKLPRNPAAAADPPAAPESRATAWTAKELGRFLEHVDGERLFALWRLAATTGMRRGELLGLTWLALDLVAGTLRVDQQLVPTRGGVSFGPPKSKRSRRSIALDSETVEALRAHREAQLFERSFAGDAYDDHDLVFPDELGQPIYPQRLTEAFTRKRKAAGLLTGTLHILRHTHATLALTNGVPVHVVAARIGDRPETVLRVYAHLLPQSDVEAAEQVAALIA
jgi:integrase